MERRGQNAANYEDQLRNAGFKNEDRRTEAQAANEALVKAEEAANQAEAAVKEFLASGFEGKEEKPQDGDAAMT